MSLEWFLFGGMLGILFAIWLNQPHARLDQINEYDITEEKLQRATHNSTCGSCLYAVIIIIIIIVVSATANGLLTSTVFTPERVDRVYRYFWNIP